VWGLEVIAEMARKLAGKKAPPLHHERLTLGTRKGTIYGNLTRKDIYDDIA
jgi:hypothetical protein